MAYGDHEIDFKNPNDEIKAIGQDQTHTVNLGNHFQSVSANGYSGHNPTLGAGAPAMQTAIKPQTPEDIWNQINQQNKAAPVMDGVAAADNNLHNARTGMQTGAGYVCDQAAKNLGELTSGICNLFKSPDPDPAESMAPQQGMAMRPMTPQYNSGML